MIPEGANSTPHSRSLSHRQAVRGLDVGSAAIRWQQKSEELDRYDAPIPTTRRMGLGLRGIRRF
jgi:hypothetical protein